MTAKYYDVTMEGTAAHGQTWKCSAIIEGELTSVFDMAMEEVFHQLTDGRAIYGKPGVGCNGPYNIKRVLIEQSPDPR